MKIHSFSVLIAIIFTKNVSATAEIYNPGNIEPYVFEDIINQTIESLRPLIPDPLTIEDLSFRLNFTEDVFNGFIQLSKPSIAGLPGFKVPALNFAMIGMRLNFTFLLDIDFSIDYLLDTVVLDLLPIYGGGPVGLHLNLELTGSSQADLKNGTKLKNFFIQIGLPDVSNFSIDGILYDKNTSTLVTQLITTYIIPPIVTFINENQEAITQVISPVIEEIINEILNGNKTVTGTFLQDVGLVQMLHDKELELLEYIPDQEYITQLISTTVEELISGLLKSHEIDEFLSEFHDNGWLPAFFESTAGANVQKLISKMLKNHEMDAVLAALRMKFV